MRFPLYFKRRVGAGSLPVLGSDTAPTFTSARDGSVAQPDNEFSHKLQFDRPTNRVAVGYWYEGSGTAVTLPVSLWVWDQRSEKWYEAATGTLTNGQITYLKCPYLADPPQTQANFDTPNQGLVALLIVSDNTSPDGTVHIVAGPDSAIF